MKKQNFAQFANDKLKEMYFLKEKKIQDAVLKFEWLQIIHGFDHANDPILAVETAVLGKKISRAKQDARAIYDELMDRIMPGYESYEKLETLRDITMSASALVGRQISGCYPIVKTDSDTIDTMSMLLDKQFWLEVKLAAIRREFSRIAGQSKHYYPDIIKGDDVSEATPVKPASTGEHLKTHAAAASHVDANVIKNAQPARTAARSQNLETVKETQMKKEDIAKLSNDELKNMYHLTTNSINQTNQILDLFDMGFDTPTLFDESFDERSNMRKRISQWDVHARMIYEVLMDRNVPVYSTFDELVQIHHNLCHNAAYTENRMHALQSTAPLDSKTIGEINSLFNENFWFKVKFDSAERELKRYSAEHAKAANDTNAGEANESSPVKNEQSSYSGTPVIEGNDMSPPVNYDLTIQARINQTKGLLKTNEAERAKNKVEIEKLRSKILYIVKKNLFSETESDTISKHNKVLNSLMRYQDTLNLERSVLTNILKGLETQTGPMARSLLHAENIIFGAAGPEKIEEQSVPTEEKWHADNVVFAIMEPGISAGLITEPQAEVKPVSEEGVKQTSQDPSPSYVQPAIDFAQTIISEIKSECAINNLAFEGGDVRDGVEVDIVNGLFATLSLSAIALIYGNAHMYMCDECRQDGSDFKKKIISLEATIAKCVTDIIMRTTKPIQFSGASEFLGAVIEKNYEMAIGSNIDNIPKKETVVTVDEISVPKGTTLEATMEMIMAARKKKTRH